MATWADRLLWALVALAWFLWIGYEDRSLTIVMLVALLLAIRLFVSLRLRWTSRGGERFAQPLWNAVLGSASGASVPVLAALLILVKVSLHNHPVPDFQIEDIQAVLGRTAVWALAGLLVGAAIGVSAPVGKGNHVAPPPSVAYNERDKDRSGG